MNSPARHIALRTDRNLARHALSLVGLTVGMLAALTVSIGAVAVLLAGEEDVSALENFTFLPRFFYLAIGFNLVVVMYEHAVHGTSRRQFFRTAAVSNILGCAAVAALMAAGFYLESIVFSANGWSAGLTGLHLFDSPEQWGAGFAEWFLVIAAHFFAGWLIGMAFYRYESGPAIVLSAFAYLGTIIGEATLGVGWPGATVAGEWGLRVPAAVSIPVAMVLITVTAITVRWMVRTAPLRPWLGYI